MRRRLLSPTLPWLAAALVGGCGASPPPARDAQRTPASAPTSAPADPPLPLGILAEAAGRQGVVRVEERAGFRLLTIDGIMQGAVPSKRQDVAVPADPLVDLVRAVRPGARTVLLIGLGTGQTAAAFAAAGLTVEVAETEAAVVDFARRFFGYRGPAVVSEGLDHLERANRTYDVVVVDASVGKAPPPHLLTREALARMGLDRESATLLVARWQGFPGGPLYPHVPRTVGARPARVYLRVFGSGVGGEEQNLYALASGTPMNLFRPALAAWPISEFLPEQGRPVTAPVPGSPGVRKVTLLGYLIRASEDGALCIDLPHYEMGAQRYRLSGAAPRALVDLLPRAIPAPTAGGIGSDADTKSTLRDVLGGGNVMRSDVRFSPVVVAVEGLATVAAVVDPETAAGLPEEVRVAAPNDPRLPWGGTLYDLTVTKVLFSMDRSRWSKEKSNLAPLVQRAARALQGADLVLASGIVSAYVGALKDDLGAFAEQLEVVAEMQSLRRQMDLEQPADRGSPFALGASCDRLAESAGAFPLVRVSEDMKTIVRALGHCVREQYRAARRDGSEGAKVATARLYVLLDHDRDDLPPGTAERRRIDAELDAMRKGDPNLEPRWVPPER